MIDTRQFGLLIKWSYSRAVNANAKSKHSAYLSTNFPVLLSNMGNACMLLFVFVIYILLTFTHSTIPATCSTPTPPENAKIECDYSPNSICSLDARDRVYRENDRVYFSCKDERYKLESPLSYYRVNNVRTMPVTCGSNGHWFPKLERLGKCIPIASYEKCDSEHLFRCKKNGRCIPKHKHCNCDIDCEDGSDEKGCPSRVKQIWAVHLNGKGSSGIISSPGYPQPEDYPKHYSCIYNITTLPESHVRLDFEEFDLPKKQNKKCVDSVRLLAVYPDFFPKRRKRPNINSARTSQTKCGSKGFQQVYSYSSHISIAVTLGFTNRKKFRGFTLSWQVKSKSDFYHALYQLRGKDLQGVGTVSPRVNGQVDDEDDSILTIVLPIVLCTMLSFLAFFLYCKVAKQRLKYKTKENDATSKNNGTTTTLTLTENNLAKFSEQMGTGPHTGSRLLPPPAGNSHASHESRFQPLLHNKKKNCSDSQNSDLPRYVMSYDIPITHSSNNPSSHSSHRQSSQNSHRLSRSPCLARTSSSSLTHFKGNRSNHSSKHYSRDNVNGSHDLGMQSSCSSQSTNTCSLCHQGKRACTAEKANYLQHHTALRHSDYYSQPSDEFDELYIPVSRHQYLKNAYPYLNENDQAGEYKEEEQYMLYQPYLPPYHAQQQHTQHFQRNNSSMDAFPKMQPDLNYSETTEDVWMSPRHRVEKRKVIYLEEICDTQSRYITGDDLYGPYHIDTDRGGSILCTH